MNKARFLTMTIITTLISLVMILISYFGITRYVMVHIKPTEGYASGYARVPEYDKEKNQKIVVASTADRMEKAKPMLSSLFDQTFKPSGGIHIYLPSDDIPKVKKSLSDKIKNNLVFLPRRNTTYGDSLCDSLIPSMLSEREGDSDIIVVRDDMIYGKDFIEQLLKKASTHNDDVIKVKHKAILFKPSMIKCDTDKICNDSTSKTYQDILNICKSVHNHNYTEIYKTFRKMP